MKRITLPLFVSVSLLAAPATAQNISVDGLVSACWLEPSSCVSLLEAFVGGLDPNDGDTQITLGILAERLYETGLSVDGRNRRDFSRALSRLSVWMQQISGSRFNEVLGLADDLIGGNPGGNGGGDGNGGGSGDGNGGGSGDGNNGNGDGNGGGTGDGNGGGEGDGGGTGDGNGGGTGDGNGGGEGDGGGTGDGNGGGTGDGNGGGQGDGNGDGGGNDGGDDDAPIDASPD